MSQVKGYIINTQAVSELEMKSLVNALEARYITVQHPNDPEPYTSNTHWILHKDEDAIASILQPVPEQYLDKLDQVTPIYPTVSFYTLYDQLDEAITQLEFTATSEEMVATAAKIRTFIKKMDNTAKEVTTMSDSTEIIAPVIAPAHQFSEKVLPYLKDMKIASREGEYGTVIGRDKEVTAVVQTLSRFKKGNPMLIGESGVGKTAVVEHLASLMADGDASIPEELQAKDIYEIDIGAMMGNSKFRGELEQKVTDVFTELVERGNCIVFMDEIHQIKVKSSSEASDIGNLMKKHLTNPKLRVIGSTTYKEFKNNIEKDSAIARRFQKVEVLEPSVDGTKAIIKGLRKIYQGAHKVKFSESVIQRIVDKAAKYISTGHFPDKAIDVLDLSCTYCKLEGRTVVKKSDVDVVVARIARVPVDQIGKATESVTKLAQNIKANVYGQDEAIDSLVQKIKVSKAGLGSEDKPVASVLFAGSSGTGKTEVCYQMSQYLGVPMLRLDMSEYLSEYAYTKLIGANAGYVDSAEGGLMTGFIENNPNSVVLIDEAEKMHPKIMQMFLQVMDNGKITDGLGRTIDCRNIILVFTSNVGVRASEEVKQGVGFFAETLVDKKTEALADALKMTFAPEFRARLDDICYFNAISEKVMEAIVTKFIKEVTDKVEFSVEVSEEVMAWLCEEGYDEGLGARPCKHLIYREVVTPLSELILDADLTKKDVVIIGKDEDGLIITVQ